MSYFVCKEAVVEGEIVLSGNAKPIVFRSPEKKKLFYRMADPWTQLPSDH